MRAGCHAFLDSITTDVAARLVLVEAPAVLGWAEWREMDAAASVQALRDVLSVLLAPADADALTPLLSGAMNEAALWLMERAEDARAADAVHAGLDRLLDTVVVRE